ncbi:MAG: condensation domain-containing protein, partial [Hyphomicrobiales bacterium]
MSDFIGNSVGKPQVDFGTPRLNIVLPLSAAQLGIWFAQQINPSNPLYNIGEYIEIEGSVDPILFEQALRLVVVETQSLHVQIEDQSGQPRQIIGSPPTWSLPLIDVSAEIDAREAAEFWMKADLERAVEPTRGPLFAFVLFKAGPKRFFWYARYHHIVMDGFGMALVARRLAELYTRLSAGLVADESSFGSLVALIEDDAAYRASDQFAQDRQYWSNYLVDRPEPVSLSGLPSAGSNSFIRNTAYLQPADFDRFTAITQRLRTSPARVITAATAIFLHRMTGAQDLILTLPVSARDPASEHTPGMTANVLPLRLTVCPSMSVSEVVDQAAQQIREGLKHQRCQIADLRRDIHQVADDRAIFGPSVNIMRFNYELNFAGSRGSAYNLSNGPVEDLMIVAYDRPDDGRLRIDFNANPALYGATELADHHQRFLRLLTGLADPDRPIGTLDILGSEERHRLLVGWNDTAHAIASSTLPELFAAQVGRTPEAV